MATDYVLYVYATRTGRIVDELPFVGVPRWTRRLNVAGTLNVTVPVGAPGAGRDELWPLLDMWRFSLALVWGTHVLAAGPMITWGFGDPDGPPTIDIICGDLWSLLDRRLVLPRSWANTNPAHDSADIRLGPASLPTVARDLVAVALNRPNGTLPLVPPIGSVPGAHVRNYQGYDLGTVGERLRQLTQVDGGPEVDFAPRLTADLGGVEHVVRIGRPALVNAGDPHVYDYPTALTRLELDGDGARMAQTWYVRGDGMERKLLTGYATGTELVDAGWPLLEAVDGDHVSARDQGTLTAYAIADRDTYSQPIYTFSALMNLAGLDPSGRTSGAPSLDRVALGDFISTNVTDHRVIPDTDFVFRLIGVESDSLTTVKAVLLNI